MKLFIKAIDGKVKRPGTKGGIDLRLPNRKTVRAMRDVQQKRNLESFPDIESMEQGLNS